MSAKILIIVPAYNEEVAIRALIQSIKIAGYHNILVIDDCSTDQTKSFALSEGARVISLPFNLGIGGAIQTAFRFAKKHGYDAAIQVDGDGQHDPEHITKLLSPVLSNQTDLCIGSRFLKSDSKGFRSTLSRRIGIQFLCTVLNALTGRKITDPTSGFRAYSKKLIDHFAEFYPIDYPEPEAVQIAHKLQCRILEIPVQMRERQGGRSSINHWDSFYYMLKVTLAILIGTIRTLPKESTL